jgi:hypothetical protein
VVLGKELLCRVSEIKQSSKSQILIVIRIMPRHRLDDPRKGTEQHLTNGPWLRRSLEWMCRVLLNIVWELPFLPFWPDSIHKKNLMSGGVKQRCGHMHSPCPTPPPLSWLHLLRTLIVVTHSRFIIITAELTSQQCCVKPAAVHTKF